PLSGHQHQARQDRRPDRSVATAARRAYPRIPDHGWLHGGIVAGHRAGAGNRARSGVHRSGWTLVAGERSRRRREAGKWIAVAAVGWILGWMMCTRAAWQIRSR